ncbi:T3SS effector HopA1 family protein [Streptomyces halobius]|uniref:T3SS effector HopA1 family protein n=1 Tax=Streptomyces halobius TaxID=2879846 RepID=A0ABY4M9H2_9ACTN|nr:T3SS effector HopA1 family protein [Streptomyces halobius]UQA94434.1 T3SS effector HopA1 family protein [Streptomyces halobius]
MSDIPVAPALLEAAAVHVAPDRSWATVGERRIEAETPRELRRLLSDALYHELHAGLSLENGSLPFRLRDAAFEAELAKGVPHRRTTARGLVRETGRNAHVVDLGGVRVRVPADRVHADGTVSTGSVVDVVNTSMRPGLSPGFFLVEGERPHRSADLLRVYLHITEWTAARTVWQTALEHLEARQCTYRAKVVSSKLLYPRRDALVVYLDERDAHAARGLAEAVGDLPGLGTETSVFTRRLRPGVAMAWEPRDTSPGMGSLSFGQHRASVLAKALVETADRPGSFAEVLHDRLVEANIDPADPSRNADSPDPDRTPHTTDQSPS